MLANRPLPTHFFFTLPFLRASTTTTTPHIRSRSRNTAFLLLRWILRWTSHRAPPATADDRDRDRELVYHKPSQ
uniref:Putative secreted protein n=1 Tax=Anopheles darlingi TaxID=43151 RepID=A0A2M4DBC1_ANODA